MPSGHPPRNQEQKEALETASYVMNKAVGGASRVAVTTGSGQKGGSGSEPATEQDKKLRNLKKVVSLLSLEEVCYDFHIAYRNFVRLSN